MTLIIPKVITAKGIEAINRSVGDVEEGEVKFEFNEFQKFEAFGEARLLGFFSKLGNRRIKSSLKLSLRNNEELSLKKTPYNGIFLGSVGEFIFSTMLNSAPAGGEGSTDAKA
jgi:hypothetical protein